MWNSLFTKDKLRNINDTNRSKPQTKFILIFLKIYSPPLRTKTQFNIGTVHWNRNRCEEEEWRKKQAYLNIWEVDANSNGHNVERKLVIGYLLLRSKLLSWYHFCQRKVLSPLLFFRSLFDSLLFLSLWHCFSLLSCHGDESKV